MFTPPAQLGRRGSAVAMLLCMLPLLLLGPGCASHASRLADVRESLVAGNFEEAFERFEKKGGKDDDLLHLLERGYLLHVNRQWAESNEVFDRAELRAEELYTESLSRQAAALLTSDLIIPFRARPYELQMVPYYRALNYLELGQLDEALVEARKADFELAQYGLEGEDDGTVQHNGFLHYFTGLLYESAGEANDAVVSFRNAVRHYDQREEALGVSPPDWLLEDYYAAARHLGMYSEAGELESRDPGVAERARAHNDNNLVLLLESGWVPQLESVDITLPIFDTKDADDPWEVASLYVDEFGPAIYTYRHGRLSLDHVLRFAFPIQAEVGSPVTHCEVILPDGSVVRADRALNLAAVSRDDFGRRMPGILLKTVARAVAKELARKGAKREGEVLGWVVNAINLATEQADTRSWFLLPGRIDVAKAYLPPGSRRSRSVTWTAAGSSSTSGRSVWRWCPAKPRSWACGRSAEVRRPPAP